MSSTVTVKLHVVMLPLVSPAVLVTIVVPTANTLPLAGTLTTVIPGQLSAAVTENITLLVQTPGAALTSRFVEQVIVGG